MYFMYISFHFKFYIVCIACILDISVQHIEVQLYICNTYIQLNFNTSKTDNLNTMIMSDVIFKSQTLIFNVFNLDILNTWIS